jgi:hypothetical protein
MSTYVVVSLLSSVLSVCPIETKRQLKEIKADITDSKQQMSRMIGNGSKQLVSGDLAVLTAQISRHESRMADLKESFVTEIKSRQRNIEGERTDYIAELGLILKYRSSFFEPVRMSDSRKWVQSIVSDLVSEDSTLLNLRDDIELPPGANKLIDEMVTSYIYRFGEPTASKISSLKALLPRSISRNQMTRLFLDEFRKSSEEIDADFTNEAKRFTQRLEELASDQNDINECISYL